LAKDTKKPMEFPTESFLSCSAVVLQACKQLVVKMMGSDSGSEAQGHLLNFIERDWEKLVEFEELISSLDAVFTQDSIKTGGESDQVVN